MYYCQNLHRHQFLFFALQEKEEGASPDNEVLEIEEPAEPTPTFRQRLIATLTAYKTRFADLFIHFVILPDSNWRFIKYINCLFVFATTLTITYMVCEILFHFVSFSRDMWLGVPSNEPVKHFILISQRFQLSTVFSTGLESWFTFIFFLFFLKGTKTHDYLKKFESDRSFFNFAVFFFNLGYLSRSPLVPHNIQLPVRAFLLYRGKCCVAFLCHMKLIKWKIQTGPAFRMFLFHAHNGSPVCYLWPTILFDWKCFGNAIHAWTSHKKNHYALTKFSGKGGLPLI